MRFDIVSVFPEFFNVLDLSLVGKAVERGLVEAHVHDLRSWTHDVHRTVDDTPVGGGAGMVMKPDVWGECIDSLVADAGVADGEWVLAIPTPSGTPLTQRLLEDLSTAPHVVIACGRYEGIDDRVARHYSTRTRVVEFSLGDYVLNGGEVAAIALIEGTTRLIPGMVGNPESLEEESFCGRGLLEYPVYTRPVEWRGLAVPDVLLSGNHAAIASQRFFASFERTAARRPELITAAALEGLTKKERRRIGALGWDITGDQPAQLTVTEATAESLPEIVACAQATFPDACPPEMPEADIAAHISTHLTLETFTRYLESPHCLLLALHGPGGVVGYSLTLLPGAAEAGITVDDGAPVDARNEGKIPGAQAQMPMAELSKFYVTGELRGSGVATFLMERTVDAVAHAVEAPGAVLWLGTNAGNRRALRFYSGCGFVKAGRRTYRVGEMDNNDTVMARAVEVA